MGHGHGHHNQKNEIRTKWVVVLTFVTMLVEIFYGITTGSMALLADGIHMGSHVLAIGISWIAYILVRKADANGNFKGDSHKILSLSGFTSSILLFMFALFIIIEATERYLNPIEIKYSEAIIVAIIGLIVNIASAFILHHDSEHSDHNIKGAYLHVLADALTSVGAIGGLIVAMIWELQFIDVLVAVISSMIIIKWAIGLLKATGKELLDVEGEGHHDHHDHENHIH